MRKVLCIVLSALMCTAVLCGCGPNIAKPPADNFEVNLSPDKNTTATLKILVPNSDGGLEEKYIEALRDGFAQLYPNVNIVYDRREVSEEGFAASINAAIASGEAPDLFYANTGLYYYLISKNCIVNLEPYYTAESEAGTLKLEDDYYTSFFAMSTYEGKRYIVPRSMDSVVTYYNAEILRAAGIDPDTDERMHNAFTWEEFTSLLTDVNAYLTSDRAKANGHGSCYALDPCFEWEAVYNAIMQSYGVEIFDAQKQVSVRSEQTAQMATMLRALATTGRTIKPYTSSNNFKSGKCAFFFSSFGPARMNEEVAVRGKFDALPFPLIGENGKIGCGFAGWGISALSDAAHRDLAWQFLRYMISKEGQMALINGGLATPSIRVDLAEEKEWSKGFETLNLDAWLVNESHKVATDYFTKFDARYTFDIQNAVQNFMLDVTDSTKNRSIESFVLSWEDKLKEAITA